MNSEYLRSFVILTQLGSYTKAAQSMCVVTSTVSKQIKLLESELGKELIIRDKKEIKLTKAGEVFLTYAHRMLDIEESCMNELDSITHNQMCIRIGSVCSLFQSHVTTWLNLYLKENVGIRCNIITDHSQTLLNMLYDGEIDACFTYRNFNESNYSCIPFVKDEMILVTGSENPTYEKGISIEELKTLPLIKESQLSVASLAFYNEIFAHSSNILLSVGMGNLAVPFLKEGNGYGFVVKRYVKKELETGQLAQIPILDQPSIFLQSYLIYKKANAIVTEEFLKHIHEYTQSHG